MLLAALGQNNRGRVPVWIMRQAGRYLPEYQALKKHYSMQQLFFTKERVEEVTLLPFREYDLDAAIVFSDILLPLVSLNCNVTFLHGLPPSVVLPKEHLEFFSDLQLTHPKEHFTFLYEAISSLKDQLTVPLIGFCGGPLTLLTYLFKEKKADGEFLQVKKFYYEHPELFENAIHVLTELVILHFKEQIKSGASVVQIFDSWAGRFPKELFLKFVCEPVKKIVQALKPLNVPIIFFSRNLGAHTPSLFDLGVDALSIDGSIILKEALSTFPSNLSIQGNFDPAILFTNESVIRKEVAKLKDSVDLNRYIGNLGHGVLPETPLENVRVFISALHELKGN